MYRAPSTHLLSFSSTVLLAFHPLPLLPVLFVLRSLPLLPSDSLSFTTMSLLTTLSTVPSPSFPLYLNTSASTVHPTMPLATITTSTTTSPHTFTYTADTVVLAALSLTTTAVSRHMEISELYYYDSTTDNDWPAETDSRVYMPYSTWTRYIPATTLTSIVTSPVRTLKAGETLGCVFHSCRTRGWRFRHECREKLTKYNDSAVKVVPPPSKGTRGQGTDRTMITIGIIIGLVTGVPLLCLLLCGCLGGCEEAHRDHRARQKRRIPVASYCDAPQPPRGEGGGGGGGGIKDIELGPLVQKPVETVVRDDIGTVKGSGWVYDEAFQGSWFVGKH